MTKQLSYSVLPLTNDPYQVFTTDVAPDGTPLHARIEIRYLAAAPAGRKGHRKHVPAAGRGHRRPGPWAG